MIKENNYFIFDCPQNTFKYFLKYIFYILNSIKYKIFLSFFTPLKKQNSKYFISICSIFKNESKYFKEWIEYHKIIGIDHFYLYNNFSEDDYKSVLDKYILDGTVTLIDWPIKQGQMSAYKDCVDKFAEETNWIAFIDLDEFIVPNTSDNIKDIIKNFNNRAIVVAYWKLFGSSGILNRNVERLVTEDFYLCWNKYTNIGKCFYNTNYEYADNLKENKGMHSRWSVCKGHKIPPVNFYDHIICNGINIADNNTPPVQINHYFTKSYYEYLDKKSRGDAFFELNPRDEDYFYWHDMKCNSTDYNIRKYLIKLKKSLSKV